jgi:hypothetical protein
MCQPGPSSPMSVQWAVLYCSASCVLAVPQSAERPARRHHVPGTAMRRRLRPHSPLALMRRYGPFAGIAAIRGDTRSSTSSGPSRPRGCSPAAQPAAGPSRARPSPASSDCGSQQQAIHARVLLFTVDLSNFHFEDFSFASGSGGEDEVFSVGVFEGAFYAFTGLQRDEDLLS